MDFVGQVRSLKIQSATTIAIKSLKYLSRSRNFSRDAKRLLEARPTAVVLHNAIEYSKKNGIKETIKELENLDDRIALRAKKILKGKKIILTHCHSTLEEHAIVKNKMHVKNVIVTETRPKYQGLLTAKHLMAKGVRVTYIVDSAVEEFIRKCDIVMVGADALRKEGLVNKIGTSTLAVVAKHHKTPFYVVTSSFAIDKRKKFVIEERPDSEIVKHLKGADVRNPAFDVTPWKYVTAVITENGVFRPRRLFK